MGYGKQRDKQVQHRFSGQWQHSLWYYCDSSLYMHPSLQKGHHQERTPMRTVHFEWLWHVNVGSSITSAPLWGGNVENESYVCVGAEEIRDSLYLPLNFAGKLKVLYKGQVIKFVLNKTINNQSIPKPKTTEQKMLSKGVWSDNIQV